MGTAPTKQVVSPSLNNYSQDTVKLTSPSLGGSRLLSPKLVSHALARTAVVSDKGGESESESSFKSEMYDKKGTLADSLNLDAPTTLEDNGADSQVEKTQNSTKSDSRTQAILREAGPLINRLQELLP